MTNPRIDAYIDLLKKYNETTNVYSASAYDKLPFHIEDCVTMAKMITNTSKQVLDMGSGSGLPSVIIAICNPNNQVVAVDSQLKKTKFLQLAKDTLALDNFTVITDDINAYIHRATVKPDFITAKAFAPLEKLLPIAKKAAKYGTELIVPLSQKQIETLDPYVQKNGITHHGIYHYLTITL